MSSASRDKRGRKRWLRLPRIKRPVRFSFAGKLFLGVAFGVGVAAVNTGNNLLYLVLSLLLSILLLSGILSELSLFRLRVRRRLPARAFVDTACLIEIEVENRKRRVASYSIQVEDQVQGQPNARHCFFLKIAPSATQTTGYRRVPSRRGWMDFRRYRLVTRFPFGLIEKRWNMKRSDRLLVYPKVYPIAAGAFDSLFRSGDFASRFVGGGVTSSELREFRPGDEARFIHWRRSASLGSTVVRERKRDAGPSLVLRVDNRRPESADADWEQGFEALLSQAASLVGVALANGIAVQVRAWDGASRLCYPGQRPDIIWAYLALLDTVPSDHEEEAWAPVGYQTVVELSASSDEPPEQEVA